MTSSGEVACCSWIHLNFLFYTNFYNLYCRFSVFCGCESYFWFLPQLTHINISFEYLHVKWTKPSQMPVWWRWMRLWNTQQHLFIEWLVFFQSANFKGANPSICIGYWSDFNLCSPNTNKGFSVLFGNRWCKLDFILGLRLDLTKGEDD